MCSCFKNILLTKWHNNTVNKKKVIGLQISQVIFFFRVNCAIQNSNICDFHAAISTIYIFLTMK